MTEGERLGKVIEILAPFLRMNRILELQKQFQDWVRGSLLRSSGSPNGLQENVVRLLSLQIGKPQTSPGSEFRPDIHGSSSQLPAIGTVGSLIQLRKNVAELGLQWQMPILGPFLSASTLLTIFSKPPSRTSLMGSVRASGENTATQESTSGEINSKVESADSLKEEAKRSPPFLARQDKHKEPRGISTARKEIGDQPSVRKTADDSGSKLSAPAGPGSIDDMVPLSESVRAAITLHRTVSTVLVGGLGRIDLSLVHGLPKVRSTKGTRTDAITMPLQSFTMTAAHSTGYTSDNGAFVAEAPMGSLRRSIAPRSGKEPKKSEPSGMVQIFALARASAASIQNAAYRYLAGHSEMLGKENPISLSRNKTKPEPLPGISEGSDVYGYKEAKESHETSERQQISPEIARQESGNTPGTRVSSRSTNQKHFLGDALRVSLLVQVLYPLASESTRWISKAIDRSYGRNDVSSLNKSDLDARSQGRYSKSEGTNLESSNVGAERFPPLAPQSLQATSPLTAVGTRPGSHGKEKYAASGKRKKSAEIHPSNASPDANDLVGEGHVQPSHISTLRHTYSKFTLEKLLRTGPEGTASLLQSRETSKSLVSMPARDIASRKRKNLVFDPLRNDTGSLDLPNAYQLRLMMEEGAKRSTTISAGATVNALAPVRVLPASIPVVRSNYGRLSSQQNYGAIGSVARSDSSAVSERARAPEPKSGYSGGSVGSRRTAGMGTDYHDKPVTLSLRTLRKMMEQIFQDELKRYGL